MNPFFYSEEAGAKGLPPLSPAPQIPAQPKPPLRTFSLRTFSVDDAEHFLHNHHASVASFRTIYLFCLDRRYTVRVREGYYAPKGKPTRLKWLAAGPRRWLWREARQT